MCALGYIESVKVCSQCGNFIFYFNVYFCLQVPVLGGEVRKRGAIQEMHSLHV